MNRADEKLIDIGPKLFFYMRCQNNFSIAQPIKVGFVFRRNAPGTKVGYPPVSTVYFDPK